MIVGLVSLVLYPSVNFAKHILGVQCPRRGWILPGGKWEEFQETFYEGAARELVEETGAVVASQKLIFHGACGEGAYTYTFLTEIIDHDVDYMHGDVGPIDWVSWDTLMQSRYKAYYQILKEIINREHSS